MVFYNRRMLIDQIEETNGVCQINGALLRIGSFLHTRSGVPLFLPYIQENSHVFEIVRLK